MWNNLSYHCPNQEARQRDMVSKRPNSVIVISCKSIQFYQIHRSFILNLFEFHVEFLDWTEDIFKPQLRKIGNISNPNFASRS